MKRNRFGFAVRILAGVRFGAICLILLCSVSVPSALAISQAALLRSADGDFKAGRFASASAKYAYLSQRNLADSELRDVLLSYCESTLREGKLAEAESLIILAKGKFSDSAAIARISFLRGEILYFEGDMKQASDAYMDFLSGNAESPLANDVIERLLLIDENGGGGGGGSVSASGTGAGNGSGSRNGTETEGPLAGYARAEFLEFAGKPDSAAATLRKLAKDFPSAQIADDARMKLGDILCSTAKYSEAVEEYRFLGASLPESPLVPLARLKMAQLYSERLNEPGKAVTEYESVIKNFPETALAVEARSELQKLKAESRGTDRR